MDEIATVFGIYTQSRYIPRLIDKDMARESPNKRKNGKTAGPSGLVLEMAKLSEEVGTNMARDLVNQIVAVGITRDEWELSATVSSYCGEGKRKI